MLLEKTISIYTSQANNSGLTTPYVEINDIKYDDKKPVLMPAKPLTRRQAKDLFALTTDHFQHQSYILPNNVLMWNTRYDSRGYETIIWLKSQIASLYHCKWNKPLLVPWPSLVFHVRYGQLNVYAIKNKKNKPTENTKLYSLPIWNTSSNGSVCTGNCDIETQHAPMEAVEFWKTLWFSSEFSHESSSGYDLDLFKFWKELHNQTEFPRTILKDTGNRLGDII